MPTGQIASRPDTCSDHTPELLGPDQCEHLEAMIAGVTVDWSVDLHYDEYGSAMIVVMPDDPDDIVGPSFIISATATSFQFDELRCDAYRTLGEHLAWADILRAVQGQLAWETLVPTTLH